MTIFRELSQYLPGGAERRHEIHELGQLVSRLEFEPGTL
jgi:hypothetical protein